MMPGFYRASIVVLSSVVMMATGFVGVSSAHFIWVAKSKDTNQIKVYFGEGLEPDQAQFLGGIENMKVWGLDDSGKYIPVDVEKKVDGDLGYFLCVAKSPVQVVDIDCNYGVFARGSSGMHLHYCAKYIDGIDKQLKPSGKLKLDVVPTVTDKGCYFQVTFDGKPTTECELTATNLENDSVEYQISANESGGFLLKEFSPGRWIVRAKKVSEENGEVDGTQFSEKRFYCTLVLDHNAAKNQDITDSNQTDKKDNAVNKTYPDLPFGITSFGAAVMNDHVYVYGGHRGEAHDYYESGHNKALYELDLKQPGAWTKVGEGIGLQGLALVSHGGKLYRLGGFTARNAKGEDADLHSVDEFAVFDFDKKQWKALAPMPTARSSFDAVVVDDVLYVVGGWTLNGSEKTIWADSAIKIDLSADELKWETLPAPPFKRRAISLGYQGDKLFVVGGMQDQNGITTDVATFDIKTNQWSQGPKLPESSSMEGFGSACFNVGGTLVVSTYGGNVYRLDEKQSQWKKITTVEPGRFFHRLLPVSDDSMVLIGGASMEYGKQLDCPVLKLTDN